MELHKMKQYTTFIMAHCLNCKMILQQTILSLNASGLRLSVVQWQYQLMNTN